VQFLNPRAWTQYIIHSTEKTRRVSRVFRYAIEVRVRWRLSQRIFPTADSTVSLRPNAMVSSFSLSWCGPHHELGGTLLQRPVSFITNSWRCVKTGTTTTKCKSLEVYQLLVTSSVYALWDPMQWYNFRQVRRQALHEPDNVSLMSKCIWLWRNHGLADQVNIYASWKQPRPWWTTLLQSGWSKFVFKTHILITIPGRGPWRACALLCELLRGEAYHHPS
jgi:hypothetical protein